MLKDKMAIIYGINSISWILIFWSALCSLTSALGYYEYDLCNSGTYNGTCLTVSKCPTLAESMRGMGLSRTDVGQCGFTVMEEIICCPHVSAANAVKTTNEVFTKDVTENGVSADVFDSTENNDEVDTCDFGTYRGICVLESQCKDLPHIMNELGLKNTDVGRCGFTPTEQIICCPNRPKSVEAPKGLTDLLKPFQFRPPPENETAASSEPNAAIDEWFSSNLKQNNSKSEYLNKQSIDDDNKQIKASTDSNGSHILDRPIDNEDGQIIYSEYARGKINSIFADSSLPSGIPIETNTLRKEEHIQKIYSVFGESPVQSGIPIETHSLGRGHNLSKQKDQVQSGISNPEPNGLAIQQDFFGNNDFNQNANRRINTIFNNNFAYSGNSADREPRKDNLCQQNSLSNDMLTQENSLRKQNLSEDDLKKLNRIFDAIPLDSGNTVNQNAQKNNCFFMQIPATNAEPSAKNSLHSGNYNEGEISKTNAILNVKTDFSGNTNLQGVKFFHQNSARKFVHIEETTSGSEHMNPTKNYKTNGGNFNIKTISNGNSDNVYTQENKANEDNSVRIHFGEKTLLGRHGISLILPFETNPQSIGVPRNTQILSNPHPALPIIRKNTFNGNNFRQHIRM